MGRSRLHLRLRDQERTLCGITALHAANLSLPWCTRCEGSAKRRGLSLPPRSRFYVSSVSFFPFNRPGVSVTGNNLGNGEVSFDAVAAAPPGEGDAE